MKNSFQSDEPFPRFKTSRTKLPLPAQTVQIHRSTQRDLAEYNDQTMVAMTTGIEIKIVCIAWIATEPTILGEET